MSESEPGGPPCARCGGPESAAIHRRPSVGFVHGGEGHSFFAKRPPPPAAQKGDPVADPDEPKYERITVPLLFASAQFPIELLRAEVAKDYSGKPIHDADGETIGIIETVWIDDNKGALMASGRLTAMPAPPAKRDLATPGQSAYETYAAYSKALGEGPDVAWDALPEFSRHGWEKAAAR